MPTLERQLEEKLTEKLTELKYERRSEIRDRAALEQNFREKFEPLNRVNLTDGEFERLLEEIITPDVFTAAKFLRERNSFTGSGKTHTSCKSSTLRTDNPNIVKCLFAVDRNHWTALN